MTDQKLSELNPASSNLPSPKVSLKTNSNPYLDKKSKQLMENIKKCTHIYEIKQQTTKLANYWREKYNLQQMIVDIKDHNHKYGQLRENSSGSNQQFSQKKQNKSLLDYQIQLFPKFKQYFWRTSIESKQISSIFIGNLLMESLKQVVSLQEWKFKKRQFLIRNLLTTNKSLTFSHQLKFGKPIDDKWVADCSKFCFSHINIEQNSQFHQRDSIYCQLKGYQNRLAKGVDQEPRIYADRNSLKYQDVFETGFCSKKIVQGCFSSFKLCLGLSVYSKCLFYKLKHFKQYSIPLIENQFELGIQSKIAFMNGINLQLLQSQMLNRNENKWMNERSSAVCNFRANLYATGNKFLSYFKLMPYNYAQFIVSDNFIKDSKGKTNAVNQYGKNIKVETQLGVGIKLANKQLFFDIPLFRMQGQKGSPRFGIRLQF